MSCLLLIALQDIKERAVYWFLFPILGICLAIMGMQYHLWEQYFLYSVLNCCIVSIVLGILYLYTSKLRKKRFLNHSLGLGDMLFFYVLAIGFPTISFVIVFAFSLLFSLAIYLFFKKSFTLSTIPLAGFMAIFLMMLWGYTIFFDKPSLYFI